MTRDNSPRNAPAVSQPSRSAESQPARVLLRTIAEVRIIIEAQIIAAEAVAQMIIIPLEEDNNQV